MSNVVVLTPLRLCEKRELSTYMSPLELCGIAESAVFTDHIVENHLARSALADVERRIRRAPLA